MPGVVGQLSCTESNSFVFHKTCTLFERRSRYAPRYITNLNFFAHYIFSKLVSTVVSTFTAYYVHLWSQHFTDSPLSPPFPSFDGRAVCYPSVQNLRDYMSWRQVDCKEPAIFSGSSVTQASTGHINNLFNTTFWCLVQQGGMSGAEAEKFLAVSHPMPESPDSRLTGV